ncbi:hypothetical protein [Ruegeria profundi]|uniref:VWFA domain-containing protein n=1 Tax=Ruegeria profundi TaxID=1685378 RepID=A0A0X3TNJ4_9RHOB|nr:hypothetical protein [Ruegeria profundi]KUJ77229.1 hypothetical protein AVO44_17740 [Ruegeria profundi]
MFTRLLTTSALSAVLAFSSTIGAEANAPFKPDPAIFVVIENGGVVQDTESASAAISFTLGELTELRRRRATRETQVHLILSASPTEIAWSGTPAQLEEQGHEVFALVTDFRATCSDLTLAYEQVALTQRITRPSDVTIINIGPFINAPYPCDQGDGLITLPQAVSPDVQLGVLALEARQLRLVNVHPDQDQVLLDHLEAAGVMDRVAAGALSFDLLDPARTRASLGNILGED